MPRLRFPEFLDANEWGSFPLSSFVESLDAGVSVNSGGRPAKKGEASVLKTSAVTCGTFDHQENKVVLDEIEIRRLKEPVCKNTIIISRMNTPDLVGANAYIEESSEDIFLPDRLWAAKSKPGTSMRFISYILGSDKGRAALSKMASGSSGSMKNITKSDILFLQVTAPAFVEQQKIADSLSSLDELIAAQACKVDALKTHKKGLMQQLFPREGETRPCLRFPEFGEPWIETKLQDLCSSVSSGRDQIDSDGLFDLYGSTSVIGKTQNASFNGERILVARVGANAGMLTKAKGSFGVTDNTLVVSLNHSINIDFLYHYLGTININKLIFGSGQPLITGSILKNLPIQVPVDMEQLRISACLSTLDELIVAQTFELDALRVHKKGLMQQLFPAPTEGAA